MSVKALYTNILKHVAIEAVKETPNNQAKKPIATQVIIKLLNLILTLTNFVINSINYLQEKAVLWVQFAHRYMQRFSWEI